MLAFPVDCLPAIWMHLAGLDIPQSVRLLVLFWGQNSEYDSRFILACEGKEIRPAIRAVQQLLARSLNPAKSKEAFSSLIKTMGEEGLHQTRRFYSAICRS